MVALLLLSAVLLVAYPCNLLTSGNLDASYLKPVWLCRICDDQLIALFHVHLQRNDGELR